MPPNRLLEPRKDDPGNIKPYAAKDIKFSLDAFHRFNGRFAAEPDQRLVEWQSLLQADLHFSEIIFRNPSSELSRQVSAD
jgi:hypothetical protein